jgi:hypothetical protein
LYFAYCGDIFGMKRTNKFYLWFTKDSQPL